MSMILCEGDETDPISMREAFGKSILKNAEKNSEIFAVSADTEASMGFSEMAQIYPDRVLNVGICEQNMTLVGAGIAACGGKVFIASYSTFTSMRILEQIRTYIAYSNLDVKIISGMGGLSGSMEGVTHQGIEEISIIRSIPNMKLIVAADICSTQIIIDEISCIDEPVYISLGRFAGPKIFNEYNFEIGKGNTLFFYEDSTVSIFSNGPMLSRVIKVVQCLREKGIRANLFDMPCVKPLDINLIRRETQSTGRLVVVEESTIIGGLGSAVCEFVASECPVQVLRIGIEDEFTMSGPYNELLDEYGFSIARLTERILKFVIS